MSIKTPSIEFLVPARVEALREVLIPLFAESCDGNEISRDNLTPEQILDDAVAGRAVVFLGFENNIPTCVLAIQFYMEAGKKGADILALAGRGLITFKRYYWKPIIEWLKANRVQYLDAYVDQKHTRVYQQRYGFDKSCAFMRMKLSEK